MNLSCVASLRSLSADNSNTIVMLQAAANFKYVSALDKSAQSVVQIIHAF